MPEFILRLDSFDTLPDCSILVPFETGDETWERLKTHPHPVYLETPSVVLESEWAKIKKTLEKRLDADGIYYGDDGILQLLLEADYPGKKICQPDTLVCSAQDVKALQHLGADCVSLAHELSLEEIRQIAETAKGVEVLVHGHFPILTSARSLISNYGQEINKVLPDGLYQLREQTRQDSLPVIQENGRTILFSPQPIKSVKQMDELKEAGVTRFRMDMRFLKESPEDILSVYRDGKDMELTGSDTLYHQSTVKTKGEADAH